jgi:hypothetical protein
MKNDDCTSIRKVEFLPATQKEKRPREKKLLKMGWRREQTVTKSKASSSFYSCSIIADRGN